jgi:hypothetical protein
MSTLVMKMQCVKHCRKLSRFLVYSNLHHKKRFLKIFSKEKPNGKLLFYFFLLSKHCCFPENNGVLMTKKDGKPVVHHIFLSNKYLGAVFHGEDYCTPKTLTIYDNVYTLYFHY